MNIANKHPGLDSGAGRYRFLFAGGGTGGHLFPAVAVAQKIKQMKPESEILFIGNKSKIEGTVVPKLGFTFRHIWIKGLTRSFKPENILFPLKLIVSFIQSLLININFKPVVAIGTGGYVSAPAIFSASIMGAKIILLEQNSYPGLTTRLLERFADQVHISFEDSKKYLRRQDRIFVTGNPVRSDLGTIDKAEALQKFNLDISKKTLLVIGGSLGARSINESVAASVNRFEAEGFQIIWQTGKYYYHEYSAYNSSAVKVNAFIDNMNAAYSACDLLIARAGATTIAEITTLGIASVLIPSPNVAANHQFYNAKSLAEKEAAILIEDKHLLNTLFDNVEAILKDDERLNRLRKNAQSLSKPDALFIIAGQAIKLAEHI